MSPKGRPTKYAGGAQHIRLEIRLNEQQSNLLNELSERYNLPRTAVIMMALEELAKKKQKARP